MNESKLESLKNWAEDNNIKLSDEQCIDLIDALDMCDEYEYTYEYTPQRDHVFERVTALERFIRKLGWEITDGNPLIFNYRDNGTIYGNYYDYSPHKESL
jgi:hypothetical protein